MHTELHKYSMFHKSPQQSVCLTHWGGETHIYVSKLTVIGSNNVLSPGRRRAIIWTNAGILLIGPLETDFSEILIEIHTFSFKKMYLKMSSGKWRPLCLSLNVLTLSISKFQMNSCYLSTDDFQVALLDLRQSEGATASEVMLQHMCRINCYPTTTNNDWLQVMRMFLMTCLCKSQ